MTDDRVATKGLQPSKADAPSILKPANTRIHWLGFWPKLFVLVAVGLIISMVTVTATATVYKNNLRTRVASVAEALNAQRVSSLKQADSDAKAKDDYNYLKQHLQRIKAVNADARFLYLMARNDDGSVYFLVDSEEPNKPGYSARGELYPEASAILRGVFDNGLPVVEGPSRDSYGDWLSGLAPIVDEQSYRMPAVLGMDVPAKTYGLLLALAGGVPLLLTMLAVVIVIFRHRTRMRHEEGLRFRAEMISIASHELRTPLTGLRWSEENALSQKLDAKHLHRSLEIMYDSTLRLQDSIEDVLQLATIDSAKSRHLVLQPTDIKVVLQNVMSMQRLPAEQRQVTVELSGNWPPTLDLVCDAQRLKRVFNNLLSNAIKYSNPETQITIGYGRANDGSHIIWIQDHGIGIPADEQRKVWSGFYRASNTQQQRVSGSGMGLFLSRNIVEQHGGRIWLESEEDRGTTVFVSLPENLQTS